MPESLKGVTSTKIVFELWARMAPLLGVLGVEQLMVYVQFGKYILNEHKILDLWEVF